MNTKISVAAVTLLLTATGLLGLANAQVPANGLSYIGPRPQDDCAVPQALGAGGNAAGSGGSPAGSNGYHSYINEASGIILDACFNLNGVAPFAGCASGQFLADLALGVSFIVAGVLSLDTSLILEGIAVITSDLLNVYQNQCGGLGGTGTDGEYEYGDKAAALNVRVGPGTAGVYAGKGDGVKSCIGTLASAHHGADTTVYVSDASGLPVGFVTAADWARDAAFSNDGTDRNTAPGISHCGDGVLEPCTIGNNGWRNDVLVDNSVPEIPPFVPPTNTQQINDDLDTIQGCNPLDKVSHTNPNPLVAPTRYPSGAALSSFGGGGAAGYLLVFVDFPSYVLTSLDTNDATVSIPTVGWVWTG